MEVTSAFLKHGFRKGDNAPMALVELARSSGAVETAEQKEAKA